MTKKQKCNNNSADKTAKLQSTITISVGTTAKKNTQINSEDTTELKIQQQISGHNSKPNTQQQN